MIRTSIVFFICAYVISVLLQNGANAGGGKPPPPPPAQPDVDRAAKAALYHKINLVAFQEQTPAYYKNALLLYFRILDLRVMKGKIITYYEELDTFDATVKNKEETIELNKNIAEIGAKLIADYDNMVLNDFGYLEKALYYRALRWISTQIDNSEINAVTGEIINHPNTENYLSEILSIRGRQTWLTFTDNKLKTIDGWLKENPVDQAVYFMYQLAQLRGKNPIETTMGCTDLQIYEDLLADVNEGLFIGVFRISSYEMIRLIDRAVYVKTEAKKINIKPPYIEATPTDEIDLATMDDAMTRYKHATILFATAFHKFGFEYLSEKTMSDLTKMPIIYSALRYGSFQWWVGTTVIEEIIELIESLRDIDGLFRLTDRIYVLRLVNWYRVQVTDPNFDHPDLKESLNRLVEFTVPVDVFDALFTEEYVNHKLKQEMAGVTTLDSLLALGKRTDIAISTLMGITLNLLLHDFKETNNECSGQKAPRSCTLRKNRVETAITDFRFIGEPKVNFRGDDREIYDDLLKGMDEGKFGQYANQKTLSELRDEIGGLLEGEGRPLGY